VRRAPSWRWLCRKRDKLVWMFTTVFTVFTVVGCFAVVGWLIWVLAHGSGEEDRRAEEAAREYFDRHGRWPDE
jgi:hypothetical protein